MRELRVWSGDLEVRAAANGKATIRGYAAVYGSESQDLGGFVETIRPGAFDRAMGQDDVRALVNHDPNRLLGRSSSGTLRLASDSTGLHYEVDVPDTHDARDVLELAQRGDLSGSSFGFYAGGDGDEWGVNEQDQVLRTLHSVARLYDVGPVTFPAYLGTENPDTSVAVRSLADHLSVSATRVQEAMEARSLPALLRGAPAARSGASQGRDLTLARARTELAARRRGA